MRVYLLGFLFFMMTAFSGCAWQSHSGGVYSAGETQHEQTIRMGTIESVREVMIDRRPSGIGAATGAIIGGIGGSNIGQGKGSAVASVLGVVAGGVVGQKIEENVAKIKGLELTVRLDNGELRAIVQEADEAFRPGERVRLLSSRGGTTRVTH